MRVIAILALITFLSAVPVGTGVSGDSSPGSPGASTPPTGTSEPGLEEFVPTEQVPADSAIAFPVDI